MGILSLLAPLLPYLLAFIGVVAGYFAIKHKGVAQERERQEAKQAEAVKQVTKKIVAAESQDAVVDAKVEKQIEKIKDDSKPAADFDNPLKFRF